MTTIWILAIPVTLIAGFVGIVKLYDEIDWRICQSIEKEL